MWPQLAGRGLHIQNGKLHASQMSCSALTQKNKTFKPVGPPIHHDVVQSENYDVAINK
jgi:hypothetical protein